MTVNLPREQQEWLEAQVRAGFYDSVDEAVASIVAERMHLDIDDLTWAKPLVDDALASLDRGEGMTLDEYRARMEARFGKLKRRGV
jgi:antitoxin ParD1/3/4